MATNNNNNERSLQAKLSESVAETNASVQKWTKVLEDWEGTVAKLEKLSESKGYKKKSTTPLSSLSADEIGEYYATIGDRMPGVTKEMVDEAEQFSVELNMSRYMADMYLHEDQEYDLEQINELQIWAHNEAPCVISPEVTEMMKNIYKTLLELELEVFNMERLVRR